MEVLKSWNRIEVRTNEQGKRVWRLIVRNEPASTETDSLLQVLTDAKRILGRVVLSVWDADKAEFTSELVADPMC